MTRAVFFDVDGVLADLSPYAHLVAEPPKKWSEFFNKGLSHNYFLNKLNDASKGNAEPDNFRKLLALFYDVTEKGFEEKVKVV